MSLDLTAGLTEKQLKLHPFCSACNWRKGGLDSWNGITCKCGHVSLNFGQLLRAADKHESLAETHDAMGHEVRGAFHETRASELRAFVACALA